MTDDLTPAQRNWPRYGPALIADIGLGEGLAAFAGWLRQTPGVRCVVAVVRRSPSKMGFPPWARDAAQGVSG